MSDSPNDSESTPKSRGLWAVMGMPAASVPEESVESVAAANSAGEAPAPLQVDAPETSAEPALRGLFAVMRQADIAAIESQQVVAPQETVSTEIEAVASADPIEPECDTWDPEVEVCLELIDDPHQPAPDWLAITEKPDRPDDDQDLRQGRISVACGFVSILLSFLALRPEVWMSIPSALVGFVAMIRGCLLLTAQSHRHGRKDKLRRIALAAIVLGTVGAFLGPLAIASFGRAWRDAMANSTADRSHSTPASPTNR